MTPRRDAGTDLAVAGPLGGCWRAGRSPADLGHATTARPRRNGQLESHGHRAYVHQLVPSFVYGASFDGGILTFEVEITSTAMRLDPTVVVACRARGVRAACGLATTNAAPLASGIDLAAADKAVRVQDDLFQPRQRPLAREDRDPRGQDRRGARSTCSSTSRRTTCAPSSEDAAKRGEQARPGSDAQKIGDFYESFMNEARAEELGLKPLEARAGRDRSRSRPRPISRAISRAMFKLNLINPLVGFVDGDARRAGSRDPVYLPGRPRPARSRLLPQERRPS